MAALRLLVEANGIEPASRYILCQAQQHLSGQIGSVTSGRGGEQDASDC